MMGVKSGIAGLSHSKPRISSQIHFLSDPLAPVRAFTIHHPSVSADNPPKLSYSNSTGSDHSLIRLNFGESSPTTTDSTSAGSNSSPVSGGHSSSPPSGRRAGMINGGGIPRVVGIGNNKSRKSRSFSSKGDTNYHLFTIDLSGAPASPQPHQQHQHKRSLGNINNGTLDFPHLKLNGTHSDPMSNNGLSNSNNTLDLPHVRLSHTTSSPMHGRRKESSNSIDGHNKVNHTFSLDQALSSSVPNDPSTSYPPPKVPGTQRKASNRSLHGVFHSRLSGPLASLQPINNNNNSTSNNKKNKAQRPNKKRHSAIAFFSSQTRDKENLQSESSSSSYHQHHNNQAVPSGLGNNNIDSSNLPSMLHQLAWMCRRHDNSLSSSVDSTSQQPPLPPPHPIDPALSLGYELSQSETSLAPSGMGPQGPIGLGPQVSAELDPRSDDSDLGRARKVSLALKALAGRLNFSIGKNEPQQQHHHHQQTLELPPLPPPSPPPLLSRLSASSSTSSNSIPGGSVQANGIGTPDPTQKRIVRALYDYKAAQKGDLSLVQDEEYEVLEETEEHWWRLRDKLGNEGYSPSNYVKECTDIGLHQYDWYLGDATRQRAETILMREEREGCFVVRNSTSTSGMYTISVFCSMSRPQVKHYHIQKDSEGKYYLSQNIKCNSISELIYKHQYNPGGLCTRLRSAPHGNKPPATAGFGRDKWDIPLTEITLMEEIGSGQFGVVRRGRYRGMDVAVKMMKEGTMSEDEFIEEAKVMTKLQHPNLVQLYGVCRRQRPVYIITEFLEYGSLLHYLRQKEKTLSSKTETLIDMCLQIAEGMAYLEKEKFIHRDLAARNCLVGSKNIKVGDFGLARYVVDDEYTGSGGAKFPIKWAAPEVLNYMRFSSKSDVWAFGVLMWEVFTCGKMPYGRRKNADVVAMVQEGVVLDQPRYCPHSVYQVMRECWEQSADQRPSFNDLKTEIGRLNSDE